MQEEVEQRIVSLMISCGKLGEQEFRKAVAKLLEQLKSDHQKHQYSKANPHGKMTVKQLAAKDKGLQSIEVTDQNIGSFNRIARKYGIDFAPFKVKGEKRYMVFFKAPDADAMTAAFKEYRAICPTVSHWLGCMGQRSRLLHSVPITEVKHNGLCQRPEGLNQSKNQGVVQPHETTAHLLRKRRAHRRTAFLLAQGQHRHQPRRHGDDGGDDPGYAVRHV